MKIELSKLEECYIGIALTQMREGNQRPMEIVVEEILNANGEEKRQRFHEEQEHIRQHVIEFADDY